MEYVTTDMGAISKENAKYLHREKILLHIGGELVINGSMVNVNGETLPAYSLFCWVAEDVRKLFSEPVDIDRIITVMREGEGMRYPKVTSIREYGHRVWDTAKERASKKTKANKKKF
jgi:hypothetical protein